MNKQDFINLVRENIKREGIEDLLKWLDTTDFYTAPASAKMHCNYEGGLVDHSVNVYKALKSATQHTTEFSNETITLVSLFHDLCKVNFYTVSTRNTKDENGKWIQVPYYTYDEKFAYGHGEKSVYLLMKYLKLTDEEAQAIRAHMGGFDNCQQDVGKIFDQNKLAVELHIADLRATFEMERNN